MKTTILLIFLTVFINSTLVAQFNNACAPNGIVLYTQQEIDSFPANYPNCTKILGDLHIIDDNTVTNLDSLIYITEVLGNFTIGAPDYAMCNLNTIEGLSNLSHIGGDLWIWNTQALNDLSGLENLENIDGFLDIRANENLSNIDALNNLESVYSIRVQGIIDNVDFIESMNYIKGMLSLARIQNMQGLQNLDSVGKSLNLRSCPQSDLLFLSNLKKAGSFVTIFNMNSITDLEGLNNLESIGGYLDISSNDSLTSIEGLNSLKKIEGNFKVERNNSIHSVNIPNLEIIKGAINIEHNDSLKNVSGFDSLTIIGNGLQINYNPNLQTFNALSSVSTLKGYVSITNNPRLQNLPSMPNLENDSISTLLIYNNDSLVDLEGLNNITTVKHDLIISTNANLSNISALSNLTDFKGRIEISKNPLLTTLSSLDGINSDSINNLTIINNEKLSFCSIESICNYLSQPNGIVSIWGNEEGCNNPVEIADFCGFTMSCLPYGNYKFTTQSEIDNFNSNYTDCSELKGVTLIEGTDILNLYGLNNVTNIQGSLEVFNTNITDLSGLNNIGIIEQGIVIDSNLNLIDISAIEHSSLQESIKIVYNESLSYCSIQSICDAMSDWTYCYMKNNAEGCNSYQEVEQACLVFVDETRPNNQLIFYPNPSHNKLYFTASEDKKITQLTIYNQLGQKVLRIENPERSINISELDKGLFVLEIEIDGMRFREKLIKN